MTAEIATVDPVAALERLDPAAREVAVTQYLTDARDRLAFALQATGPQAVAAIKAEIATAAEATKQLGLSREIQQDAQEMVRRAEYALGKAIRAGQERGEIRKHGEGSRDQLLGVTSKLSPLAFVSQNELSGADSNGIYAMVDDVTEAEFDAAIDDARAEGNVSRANVVRKIRGVKEDGLTPVEKLRTLRQLATTGRTSDQIAKEIGCTEEYVRRLARDNSIEIVADLTVRRGRRLDSNLIIAGTVEAAALPMSTVELVNYEDPRPRTPRRVDQLPLRVHQEPACPAKPPGEGAEPCPSLTRKSSTSNNSARRPSMSATAGSTRSMACTASRRSS